MLREPESWLSLACRKTRSRVTGKSFPSLFGLAVQLLPVIWAYAGPAFRSTPDLYPFHLLWALYFLKVYPTGDQGATFWLCDRSHFGSTVWRVLFLLRHALPDVRSLLIHQMPLHCSFQLLLTALSLVD